MASALTVRVCTGTNAATESAAQSGIAFLSVDAATNDPNDHEVVPGTNSYEKWLRVAVDTAAGVVTNFWIERSGDLPDGVVIKMGVTDTGVTPTASTSAVATTTMAAGRRYVFDVNEYDTTNDRGRYVVLQEQVAASAQSGAIEQQDFTIGYAEG